MDESWPHPVTLVGIAAILSVWLILRLRTFWRRRREVQPVQASVISYDDRDDPHNPAYVAYEVDGQQHEADVKIPRHVREITDLIDPADARRAHATGQPPTVLGTTVLAVVAAAMWLLTWYARERAVATPSPGSTR